VATEPSLGGRCQGLVVNSWGLVCLYIVRTRGNCCTQYILPLWVDVGVDESGCEGLDGVIGAYVFPRS